MSSSSSSFTSATLNKATAISTARATVGSLSESIMHSINKNGITPPQTCSIRGATKNPGDGNRYCYNQVDLAQIPATELEDVLTDLVYDGKEGFWAISMERAYKKANALELSQATMNSLVFLFELPKFVDANSKTFYTNVFGDDRLCNRRKRRAGESAQSFNADALVQEYLQKRFGREQTAFIREVRQDFNSENTGIKRSAIKAILAPYHLVDSIRAIFKDLTVIPVNAIQNKLESDVIEVMMTGKSALGLTIAGPNYLRGLELFTKAFPEVKKLGVHLTRLPSNPIPSLSDKMLDIDEYNKTHWKTTRLKNPKEDHLSLLKTYSSDVLLFSEGHNQYLVIYRAELANKVAAMVTKPGLFQLAAKTIQNQYRSHLNKPATLFFKDRTQHLLAQKKQLLELANKNQFARCAEVAAETALAHHELLAKADQHQKLSAIEFRASLKKS